MALDKKNLILSTTILIFLLMLINGCTPKSVAINSGKEIIYVNVEVANDEQERQQGLMFREFLDENSGMLFIFNEKAKYGFWMKNTLIPLDVVYIDEDLNIVDIIYAEPCKEDPCFIYKPKSDARYVLEVNGNFTAEHGISVGNKVKFQ